MMTVKVVESVSWVFLAQRDVPIPIRHMIELLRRDLSEHHSMQFPIADNQIGTMGVLSQIAGQVVVDYRVAPDFR